MDTPPCAAAVDEEEGEEAKVVITCFVEFVSKANLDGDDDDGGGDEGREYRRAKRENVLKRRWISSVLAMAGREVDAGVVDPADGFYYKSVYVLHESSRDLRHVRKTFPWHEFYNMNNLSPRTMDHWNNCSYKGDGCKEDPNAKLQIFDVKVLPFTLDVTRPVEVYGIIAVRDDVDEIKVEGEDAAQDLTMADGCVDIQEHRCGFDCHFKNRIDGALGTILKHSMVIQAAVEATIQLEFHLLPAAAAAGFRIRMMGYTARGQRHGSTYVFAGDGREFDGFIHAAGELEQKFVAAVKLGDTLELSFMEEGREPLAFMSARHDSEVKPYRFQNGALVFVKVSWSVMELGP
uniref:DUF6598 domain-containing protein n=1 Tax=Oryza punctata TaxID=4537 RepID=A0A0E0MGW3_ORYPU